MNPTPPDPAYLAPYRQAVKDHGPSFEATLWANKSKQADRFAVIADMLDLTGRTILDAGAGQGDLARWLLDHNIPFGAYIGVEGIAEMTEHAKTLDLPESTFTTADFTDANALTRIAAELGEGTPKGVDIIVFSGSLNTFEPDAARAVLDTAWAIAREGLAFNFLSTKHHNPAAGPSHPAVRFDPLPMLDWALTKTPRVRFRQDYFDGHDATISMRKLNA